MTDDTAVIHIKRSWCSIIPHLMFALLVTALVVYLTINTKSFGVEIPIQILDGEINLTFPLFLLVLGVLLARPIFLLKDTRHILTERHIYTEFGRFSLFRKHSELAFEEMLGVRFEQSLLERILTVGTISVWTASADHPEVVMKGVRRPEVYTKIIRERIDKNLIKRKQQA